MTIDEQIALVREALAYAGGSHTLDDIRMAVETGRMQLWPAPSSTVVTEIIEFPQYRACNVFLAGGTLAEIKRLEPVICEWARQQGCKKMTFVGRRGWERTFLVEHGWENTGMVVLEKAL